jgi:ribosomal protein L3 glutamine methyltransferase
MPDNAEPVNELTTVRDWLRYAVSRFNAAGLVYGHGTTNAFDEAAFLVLHTLNLPVNQLEPWLDARLLISERRAVNNILEMRITTRKPAPYLTHEAWIGSYSFYVDERVIVPRSYLGELLCRQMEAEDGESPLGLQPAAVGSVLEMCQ